VIVRKQGKNLKLVG